MRTLSRSGRVPRLAAAVAGLAAVALLTTTGGAAAASSSAPYKACRAADVTADFLPGSGGSGWHGTNLRLTNTSNDECSLYGWPGLQFVSADGVPQAIPVTDSGTPRGVGTGPGGQLYSTWYWSYQAGAGDICPTVPATVVVTLPGGSTLDPLPWPGGAICADGGIDVGPISETATP